MKKISTILCDLFGHKFVWDARASEYANPKPVIENFCIRCGTLREDIYDKEKPKTKVA